jgi:lycopene cyclase domain-containing protein
LNSNYLYLTVNLASIAVPFLASFYPPVPFYKKWKWVWPAILIPAILFIIWDEYFTNLGIWGFNPEYLTGIYVGSLPLEEVLFFVCIPYACLFTYFALNHLIKRDLLWQSHDIISSILIVALFVVGVYFIENAYTATTFVLLASFLAYLVLKKRARFVGRFYISFAVILIPFFIVNGILTGSFIEGEVVWYNDDENLRIRLGTIPLEDVFYGMLLLLMNVTLYEFLQVARRIRHH